MLASEQVQELGIAAFRDDLILLKTSTSVTDSKGRFATLYFLPQIDLIRLRSSLQTRWLLYLKGLLPAAIPPQLEPICLQFAL